MTVARSASGFPVPTKTEAATADRLTLRYKSGGQWQAVRVLNTAYYDDNELTLIVARFKRKMRDEGKPDAQAYRWSPKVISE